MNQKTLSPEQIFALYKKYRTPKAVINHMLKVAEVARYLCERLEEKGIQIDKNLVEAAALLHDLVRVCDFRELTLDRLGQKINSDDLKVWLQLREKYKKIGHSKAASQILKTLKQKEIANLIEKHAFHEIDNLKTLEEKILYYSDKRVDGDNIVTLKKRFKLGHVRNHKQSDDIEKSKAIEKKVFELEKELLG